MPEDRARVEAYAPVNAAPPLTRAIEHRCPYSECGARLTTTLRRTAPEASWGATSVPVKCPRCLIRFGLWVPLNQAGYVDKTVTAWSGSRR